MRLHIHLVPGSRSTGISQLIDLEGNTVWKIKIRQKPINGEANKGLIEYLHDVLGLPKKDICIVSGQTSRLKVVEVEGDESNVLKKLSVAL